FQAGQPVKYVNAVAGIDWIGADPLLNPLNANVIFHQGQTQATCTVQAVGDDLIEPNEFLTATIVGVSGDPTIGISLTNGSATATILNDDGNLRDDVKINGLSVVDPQLANLLTQDIQAAVARIEQALNSRVPPLKIDVVFNPTKVGRSAPYIFEQYCAGRR